MEESVLLGTKPLVDSIRHFIRDPSASFSVCHLCDPFVSVVSFNDVTILANWFLHITSSNQRLGVRSVVPVKIRVCC